MVGLRAYRNLNAFPVGRALGIALILAVGVAMYLVDVAYGLPGTLG